MLRERGRVGLMAAALVVSVAGAAQAQVTTELSASILVFPKIVSNGTRDTIIQISNTSNGLVYAHCFYVNGALTFPDLPPGPLNPPLWTEVDFELELTKQQPTHWVVSQGRLYNPFADPCTNNPPFYACNDAGLFVGESRVPPVVEDFMGELKCIEVDAPQGHPVSGNHLKGEATMVDLDHCVADVCTISGAACVVNEDCPWPGMVGKYNALGFEGNNNNNGDNVLCLGGDVDPDVGCPTGAEYDACPQYWVANHFAEGAPEPVNTAFDVTPTSRVDTAWTFVPCTENFETQAPETVTVAMQIFNEYEQVFSASLTFTCWAELTLGDINPTAFDYNTLGTSLAQTRLRSSAGTASGFLMVGEESHSTFGTLPPGPFTALSALNYHVEGERTQRDLITIPADQVKAP